MGRGKDLIMAERRRFTATFKRQVVEELLSESSTLAQLSRRYDPQDLSYIGGSATNKGAWSRAPLCQRRNFERAMRSWSGWWADSPWRMIF